MALPDVDKIKNLAYEYADKQTADVTDRSLKSKSWAASYADFLFSVISGVYLLINETSQTGITSVIELENAYILLAQLAKAHGHSINGSIEDLLVYSGIASSKSEVLVYLSLARLKLEQSANKDLIPPTVPMIGVVGQISSGKGTVGQLIKQKHQGEHFPLSDSLRFAALALGSDLSFPRDKLRMINDAMKPVHGNEVYVRWTIQRSQRIAEYQKLSIVSMDGFRSVEEAQYFKDQGGVLIGVQASQETRFQRLQKRSRQGDDDWNKFLESDKIESGWISPIFEICDYQIDNNGSQAELETQFDAIMSQVLQKVA